MKTKKIMIVEDEKLTMLFIEECLKEEGYKQIKGYASGQEIINDIKKNNKPDLILMDININGSKDGIQTGSEILKYHQVPIVFMSAYNDKQTIKEVLSVSLYGFLSKPFNERELFIAMELAFENFSYQQQKNIFLKKNSIELFRNCFYHFESKVITYNEQKINLHRNQKILLDVLVKNINKTVDKEQLSFEIWSTTNESSSALRTVVYLLRKKLNGIQISAQSKRGYLLSALTQTTT